MVVRILLFCLFLQGAVALGQDRNYPEARPLGFILPDYYHKATIPFEIYNNLIVIDVLLNQSLPLKFILDTGVRTTVLTEKTLSDLLNMEYSRKITIPGVGGEKLVDAFVVNDVSLNIGAIQGEGHALLVLEKDLLQLKNFLGVNVHGILGYELFSRFIVDINYAWKEINIYRPHEFSKKKRFDEFDISIEDTKPYIYANLAIREGDGIHEGKFLIDTGASHTLLLDSRSDEFIYCPEPNLDTNLGRGLGGDINGKVARIDFLGLDEFAFKEVIATFPDEDSYDLAYEDKDRNGSLGGGMMSRFHTIYDYANGKLYIKKGKGYGKPFEFNLSGVIVKAAGVYLREFEIDKVRPESEAALAGLEKGDKILSINGVRTSGLTLDQVIGKLNEKENRRIRVQVERHGQKLMFSFRLKRLI